MPLKTPALRPARLALCAGLLLAGCASPAARSGTVQLQILGINDFHGYLEAPTANGVAQPGGAARIATLVKSLRAEAPQTVFVGAGDLIGASPLLSALFNDEPTVESLSEMGLALSAVGNHEMDDGAAELKRLQTGGCHPVNGCKGPAPFKGAKYAYLSANILDAASGKPVFPTHLVRTYGGVRIGFIGATVKGLPGLIPPSSSAGLDIRDEAESINAVARDLKAKGVEALVVVIHEGGYPGAGPDACPGMSGAITAIAPRLDPAIDIVVSGHTHRAYVCRIDGRLVTSAGLYGAMITDIDVTLDRKTRDIVAADARNIEVRPETYAEDPGQAALIGAYRRLAEPIMQRPIGRIAETLSNEKTPAGEMPIGKVIADAMRAAAEKATGQRIDIALMNSGGVRARIERVGDGAVTYADAFRVQPFNDPLIVMTLRGRDLESLFTQQFSSAPPKLLQISAGSSFRWRQLPGGGGQVVPGSLTINGRPLDPAASYRVVTTGFLANGGDGFTAFKAGTNAINAGSSVDALGAYITANAPLSAPAGARIELVP